MKLYEIPVVEYYQILNQDILTVSVGDNIVDDDFDIFT